MKYIGIHDAFLNAIGIQYPRMILKDLILTNFRSYQKAKFTFSPTTTIMYGPNAVGKTNILEAISLLSVGKSFRAESEREMVKWEKETARIKSQISELNDQKELEVALTTGVVGEVRAPIKRYLVNGVVRRHIDFVGNLRTVLFWPQDLELVTHAPSLRRRYLDFVLTQIDREYRRSLISYEKGVRQRNRVLEKIREGEANRSQLLFWDQLLIKTGYYLTEGRSQFIDAINKTANPFGAFTILYDPSFISEARLDQYKDAEVASATTLVGPHRDDWRVLEEKRDIAAFGSRGEQRLAVLWLKMAELEYVSEKSGTRPLLLLDDIFSELDHAHREEVVNIVEKQQTILTTADKHFLPERLVKRSQMIELGE